MKAPQPRLSGSWRGRYPFRVGAPSFVLADDYLPNVRFLGPSLDHVELLFLESGEGSPPSSGLVRELAVLRADLGMAYTVHLPTDLSLGADAPAERRKAAAALARVLDRIAPLSPAVSVLHLDPPKDPTGDGWRRWEAACCQSLSQLPTMPGPIAVENLFYPFGKAAPIVASADLAVCMDTGHLVRQGQRLTAFFDAYRSRIRLLHLQGADRGREHLALDRLPPSLLEEVKDLLVGFDGWVTLEVFDRQRLESSLAVLDRLMGGQG